LVPNLSNLLVIYVCDCTGVSLQTCVHTAAYRIASWEMSVWTSKWWNLEWWKCVDAFITHTCK